MTLHLRAFRWNELLPRVRGMFNLNDPRWGRGDEKPNEPASPHEADKPPVSPPLGDRPSERPGRQGATQGPPDLD